MKIKNSPKFVSHFSSAAVDVNKRRSMFHRPSKHSTTFPTGKLIPIYVDEVLPGGSRKINLSSVLRGATPKYPVLDNAYCDVTAFFVPYRLVFEDFEHFMGQNDRDYWTSDREYTMPKITVNNVMASDLVNKTYVDYLGCIGQLCGVNEDGTINYNVAIKNRSFNALYTRGICKVWNDWFRNQNVQDPCHIFLDDEDRNPLFTYYNGEKSYVDSAEFGGALLPVNKFKDYFTSSLPAPQKHDPITIPMTSYAPLVEDKNNLQPLKLYSSLGQSLGQKILATQSRPNSDGTIVQATLPTAYGTLYSVNDEINFEYSQSPDGKPRMEINGINVPSAKSQQVYTALSADLSAATAVTVNQLRMAFQTQKFYETMARGGSRYTEILLSMFGTYSSDARLQRAEYLGGKRIPINQYQVSQTATGGNGLGDTGAFSLTSDSSYMFEKGFVEHGMLFFFAYVRTDQTYSQGQERMFARRDMLDFYFPVFAHLGEQPVLRKELFYSGDDEADNEVFGYQEAWAEYRYKPNRVSGYMRPHVDGSLAEWNYSSNFENAPILNSDFTRETDNNVKRTQAVEDDVQWIADFYFDEVKAEVMPVYSVPGLDHF